MSGFSVTCSILIEAWILGSIKMIPIDIGNFKKVDDKMFYYKNTQVRRQVKRQQNIFKIFYYVMEIYFENNKNSFRLRFLK